MLVPETPDWDPAENPAEHIPTMPIGSVYEEREQRLCLLAQQVDAHTSPTNGEEIRPMQCLLDIFRSIELAHDAMEAVPLKGWFRKSRNAQEVLRAVEPYSRAVQSLLGKLDSYLHTPVQGARQLDKSAIAQNAERRRQLLAEQLEHTEAMRTAERIHPEGDTSTKKQERVRAIDEGMRLLAIPFIERSPEARLHEALIGDAKQTDDITLLFNRRRKAMIAAYKIAHDIAVFCDEIAAALPVDARGPYKGVRQKLVRLLTNIEGFDPKMMPLFRKISGNGYLWKAQVS